MAAFVKKLMTSQPLSIHSRVAISTLAAAAPPIRKRVVLVAGAVPSECTHYQCFVNKFMGQKAVSSPSGGS